MKKALKLGQIVLGVSVLALMGCKKNLEESDTSVDPVEASVESGLTMVSGTLDDQSSVSYASNSQKAVQNLWATLLIQEAWASGCQRAYQSTCQSGLKTASYSSCVPTGTSLSVTGNVTLTYSHTSCSMTTNGDSVTRTYDLEFEGPRGGSLTHSSDVQSDYRGTSFGGGGKLTKTALGWDLEILGRHSTLNFRNRKLIDVSVRTTSPVAVSGSLSRSSRLVNGGQIEVNHNIAQFTTVVTPNNLQWSASCCHPTSGSLSLVFSGSKTGSATVSFEGCGSARVDQGGQSTSIEMSYCE